MNEYSAEDIIKQLERYQAQLIVPGAEGIEITDPGTCSDLIVKIRMLLVQLADKASDAKKAYNTKRAVKFHELIDDGEKRTPAKDFIKFDKVMAAEKAHYQKLENYVRYVDSLVSAIQSNLKVKASGEKHQY